MDALNEAKARAGGWGVVKPRRTPSSNHVFEMPGGTEDQSLWCRLDTSVKGTPTIASVWYLTALERKAIAAGANIELVVWGGGHPPVALRTTTEPLGKGKEPA